MTEELGWDAVADEFIRDSELSSTGVDAVRAWALRLPEGATVLDLGCGPGTRRSSALRESGVTVYAVDASPRLLTAYRQRFPDAKTACEDVMTSPFFDRTFDAALAWGLIFLLPPDAQRELIHRVAGVLNPGGGFLFTAPSQVCEWDDLTTGRRSRSLGADEYRRALGSAGVSVRAEYNDEGENHYYECVKQR